MSSGPEVSHQSTAALDDREQLHKLGYAQELFRSMGGFQNFAISFTIISILAGCLTSYAIAFNQGGPVAITWGWLLVGTFCIFVSLALGEIASTYPTAGGLYFWSSKLGSPAWGWFTGWFNLVGQIAVTAAIGFGCAIFMTSWLNLITDGSYGNTYHWIYLTYAGIMLAAGLINMFKVSITAMLNAFSAWWHMIGVLFIVFVLIIVPDHHRSVGYVFGQTINNTGFGGGKTSGLIFFYVFLTGLLMAQYTITGYDASAHMSEETRKASLGAAWGMVMSVVVSVIFGFILLVAVTFVVPDDSKASAAGTYIVTYIWQTSMSTHWAEVLLFIAVLAQVFCTIASTTSASRMMFAFSRDRAVPGHQLWKRVSKVDRIPIYTVWAIVVLAFLDTASGLVVRLHRLCGVDGGRGDRALHRLPAADHPSAQGGRELRAQRVDAREALQVDRLDRDPVDLLHLHHLHAAVQLPRHPVEHGVRLEPRQLHADHGRRGLPALRRLVCDLGQELVQGPDPHG